MTLARRYKPSEFQGDLHTTHHTGGAINTPYGIWPIVAEGTRVTTRGNVVINKIEYVVTVDLDTTDNTVIVDGIRKERKVSRRSYWRVSQADRLTPAAQREIGDCIPALVRQWAERNPQRLHAGHQDALAKEAESLQNQIASYESTINQFKGRQEQAKVQLAKVLKELHG